MSVDRQNDIIAEYTSALDSFVEQLQRDSNILAAIVYGSLVRGDVWSESDIDMLIITKDESLPYQQHWLKDGDILIQIDVHSRKNFRDWMDVPLQGSVLHHIIYTGKLLFSNDDTITEYYENPSRIGDRDKSLGMMIYADNALGYLSKVRKSIVHQKDAMLAFRWLNGLILQVAHLEVLSHGDVPSREVTLQARKYNPDLFGKSYFSLLEEGVTLEACETGYNLCQSYLEKYADILFEPIAAYILEQGGHCGISQIDKHFRKKLNRNDTFTLISSCEFLARLGLLQKMVYPLKLTSRSRFEVYEAGYLCMESEML
ncbi:MAG: nucleotidyltransferase domain-containing protein [Candidatus Thorarchaeota archaeon]